MTRREKAAGVTSVLPPGSCAGHSIGKADTSPAPRRLADRRPPCQLPAEAGLRGPETSWPRRARKRERWETAEDVLCGDRELTHWP